MGDTSYTSRGVKKKKKRMGGNESIKCVLTFCLLFLLLLLLLLFAPIYCLVETGNKRICYESGFIDTRNAHHVVLSLLLFFLTRCEMA